MTGVQTCALPIYPQADPGGGQGRLVRRPKDAGHQRETGGDEDLPRDDALPTFVQQDDSGLLPGLEHRLPSQALPVVGELKPSPKDVDSAAGKGFALADSQLVLFCSKDKNSALLLCGGMSSTRNCKLSCYVSSIDRPTSFLRMFAGGSSTAKAYRHPPQTAGPA